MLGTLTADAEDDGLAESVLDTFEGQDDVAVGGAAVVGLQLGSTVSEDLARAELFAFPLLVVLSLIFFRGRAALMPLVVGDHDRARHLPGAHRGQRRSTG